MLLENEAREDQRLSALIVSKRVGSPIKAMERSERSCKLPTIQAVYELLGRPGRDWLRRVTTRVLGAFTSPYFNLFSLSATNASLRSILLIVLIQW